METVTDFKEIRNHIKEILEEASKNTKDVFFEKALSEYREKFLSIKSKYNLEEILKMRGSDEYYDHEPLIQSYFRDIPMYLAKVFMREWENHLNTINELPSNDVGYRQFIILTEKYFTLLDNLWNVLGEKPLYIISSNGGLMDNFLSHLTGFDNEKKMEKLFQEITMREIFYIAKLFVQHSNFIENQIKKKILSINLDSAIENIHNYYTDKKPVLKEKIYAIAASHENFKDTSITKILSWINLTRSRSLVKALLSKRDQELSPDLFIAKVILEIAESKK